MRPPALCLLIFAVLGAHFVTGAEVELTHWVDAAQDSTGVVWAVGGDGGNFSSNDGSGWKHVDWERDPRSGMRPRAMTHASHGAVVILWQDIFAGSASPNMLSEHCGHDSRIIARFAGALGDRPALFVDTMGRSWITQAGRDIYRIEASGEARVIHKITDAELLADKNKADQLNAIHACEGAHGEVWFWSEGFGGGKSLRSFLVYDGEKFVPRGFAGLPPDARTTVFVPGDGRHAFAAVWRAGLYRLDLAHGAAQQILEPKDAFHHRIRQIIPTAAGTYVIALGRDGAGDLWVVSEDGGARKVRTYIGRSDGKFPFLRRADGLLLGSRIPGMSFLPDGAEDFQRLDWRSNFPFLRIHFLFDLPNGQLLGIARGEGSVVFSAPPWMPPPDHPRIEIVEGNGAPVKDDAGHLWLPDAAMQNAREWDGKEWHEHPLPPHERVTGPLLADNRGRIWANVYEPMFVWEPARKEWRQETDLHRALEKELRADPKFVLRSNDVLHLSFSGDGRVALRDDTGVWLEYFNGRVWQKWDRDEIRYALPHFDERGELSAFDRNQLWKFDGRDFHAQPGPAPAPAWIKEDSVAPRMAEESLPYDSMVPDETGAFWVTNERRLYRQRGKLRVPVFAAGETTPFADGRLVEDVVRDSVGNFFITTSVSGQSVFLRRENAPPKTFVQVKAKEDSLSAKMQSDGTGRHWFEWRLDHADWSEPTEKDEIVLAGLANGRHTFVARALDEGLALDERGASASCIIFVDHEKQRTEAMRQLSSPDFSRREEAVRKLVKQGRSALPALERARRTAPEEKRWWIDAALQEITRAKAAGAKASPAEK